MLSFLLLILRRSFKNILRQFESMSFLSVNTNIALGQEGIEWFDKVLYHIEIIMVHLIRRYDCRWPSTLVIEFLRVSVVDCGIILAMDEKCGTCHLFNEVDVAKTVTDKSPKKCSRFLTGNVSYRFEGGHQKQARWLMPGCQIYSRP